MSNIESSQQQLTDDRAEGRALKDQSRQLDRDIASLGRTNQVAFLLPLPASGICWSVLHPGRLATHAHAYVGT